MKQITLSTAKINQWFYPQSTPFLFPKSDSSGRLTGNARYEGFIKDLLESVSGILKFKYRLIMSEDGKYGAKDNATGQWNGMIGMINNDES